MPHQLTEPNMTPSTRLQELKLKINSSLNCIQKNSQDIMLWVNEIKSKGYWREEAETWSQFCENQDWTKRRFEQLASGGAVLLSIPEEMRTIVHTESQTRELAKAAPKDREKVVKRTVERDGKSTAKGLAKTIENKEYEPTEPAGLSEPKEKAVVKDELGWPIPPESLDFWNRRDELTSLMQLVSKVKCAIEKGRDASDPLFLGLDQSIIGELKTVYYRMRISIPYAVCTTCSGRPGLNGNCVICHSTGFIHEEDPSANPYIKDILEIRKRTLAKQAA